MRQRFHQKRSRSGRVHLTRLGLRSLKTTPEVLKAKDRRTCATSAPAFLYLVHVFHFIIFRFFFFCWLAGHFMRARTCQQLPPPPQKMRKVSAGNHSQKLWSLTCFLGLPLKPSHAHRQQMNHPKRGKKKLNTKNWNEATNETSSEDFWAQKQFAFVVCWPAIIRLEKPKNKLKEKTPKKV